MKYKRWRRVFAVSLTGYFCCRLGKTGGLQPSVESTILSQLIYLFIYLFIYLLCKSYAWGNMHTEKKISKKN
jgi:uncharacterized membrane protein YjjP (DUF1212 family)